MFQRDAQLQGPDYDLGMEYGIYGTNLEAPPTLDPIYYTKNGLLKLHMLGYADDVVLFFRTIQDAQRNLDQLNIILRKYGLTLNDEKCKYQVMATVKVFTQPDIPLMLNERPLDKVEEYVYLGSVISSRAVDRPDVERRLKLAKGLLLLLDYY